jgi:hypothetical protein
MMDVFNTALMRWALQENLQEYNRGPDKLNMLHLQVDITWHVTR